MKIKIGEKIEVDILTLAKPNMIMKMIKKYSKK